MNKNNQISFNPARMRQARQKRGLSIEEASRRTSTNKMTLLRYECGDIHTVSVDRLNRLAGIYGTSPAWLTGIAPEQEFLSCKDHLLLSPVSADPPSHLGLRLLSCIHFLSSTDSRQV